MMSATDYWPEVELRHLQVLQAIAQESTFWGAAERLDCSQSAISERLAALERIVGQRLVERSRGRRRVELTEAGSVLLRHVADLSARLSSAHAELVAFKAGVAGTLRVGAYQSVAARIVPILVRDFTRSWPGVKVRLVESATDEHLLQQLRVGALDLAFAVEPVSDGSFETVSLLRDPYVLVVPADWSIGAERPVGLSELQGIPLISYRGCHNHAEEELRRRGVEPQVVFRSDDNGAVQGLAREGMGVALAARLAVNEDDAGVRVVTLPELPERAILLAWHRDRYRAQAAEAFVETAKLVCARLQSAAHHLQRHRRPPLSPCQGNLS